MDERHTMEPPGFSCSNIASMAYLHVRNIPRPSTAITWSQSSGVASTMLFRGITPALATSTSTRPNESTAAPMILFASSTAETSPTTETTSAPCPESFSSRSPSPTSSTSLTTSRAPSLAKSSAVARPMPFAAPVTTAVLPPSLFNPVLSKFSSCLPLHFGTCSCQMHPYPAGAGGLEGLRRRRPVGYEVVDPAQAGDLEEGWRPELAVVGEQHHAVGGPHHGPLGLHHVQARLAEHLARHRVDADEGDVHVQAVQEGLGVRAEQREGAVPDLTARHHDRDPRGLGQHGGDPDVVGDGRHPEVPPAQRLGRGEDRR